MTDKFTNQGFHEDFDAYLADAWEMEDNYFDPTTLEDDEDEENNEE